MATPWDVPYEDFKLGQNIRLLFFLKVKSVLGMQRLNGFAINRALKRQG